MNDLAWRRVAGVVAVALLATGCAGASTGPTPSAATTTVMQGWESYFRLDWTAEPKPSGQEIAGYIYNTYGSPAKNVRVLAQGLDPKGNVVAQKLEWVPGGVPPLNRSYFKVAGLPPANTYRVSVWAFDWVQGADERR